MRRIVLFATSALVLACGPGASPADEAASNGSGAKADWPTGAACGEALAARIAQATVYVDDAGKKQELLYLSESDRPLVPVQWSSDVVADGGVDEPTLRRLLHVPGDAVIEERGFLAWFDGIAVAQDWMDDQQRADARRFAALRDLMDEELVSKRVFRYALPSDPAVVQVYVVGRDGCGGIVGFFTEAVET
jgi:hypothetical protein